MRELAFMSIRWARCNIVTIAIIFLPLLIAHPNGWKLFLFPLFLWRTTQEHSFSLDHPLRGTRYDHFRSWAELFDMLNISHCKTNAYHVLRWKVQSKDCIAASRMHFMPAPLRLLGPRRSLGSSWDSAPSQGKTLAGSSRMVWCTRRCTPATCTSTVLPVNMYSAMYSVINLYSPNCCPYCLSTLLVFT